MAHRLIAAGSQRTLRSRKTWVQLPRRVIPKTLKMVFTDFLLGAEQQDEDGL